MTASVIAPATANEIATLDRIVRHCGLVVSRDKVDGAIGAVNTLRRIYKRSGAAVLSRTLRIVRDAYGDAGLEAMVLDGVGLLCGRYNGDLDDLLAVTKLTKVHGGGSVGSSARPRSSTDRRATPRPTASPLLPSRSSTPAGAAAGSRRGGGTLRDRRHRPPGRGRGPHRALPSHRLALTPYSHKGTPMSITDFPHPLRLAVGTITAAYAQMVTV